MSARYAERPAHERRETTEALIAGGQTDLDRWARPENLKTNWAQRAETVARLIPAGATVLDLGCGAMDLERFLDPSVSYVPADLVQRDERTLLCDLNAGNIPDVEADVVSMLGVLEYVHDVPALFTALHRKSVSVIATYNPVDLAKPGQDRRAQGWFNDFTSAELCALALASGFCLVGRVTIGPQHIYEWRPV